MFSGTSVGPQAIILIFFTSLDGLKWMDAGCVFSFSGFEADKADEVGKIGKAEERLLPARLVLSPTG